MVYINRVAKVVKGGRALQLQCADRGRSTRTAHVGAGLGKANEVPEAIRKGTEQAQARTCSHIPARATAIPHEVVGNLGAGQVLLKPASQGDRASSPAARCVPWSRWPASGHPHEVHWDLTTPTTSSTRPSPGLKSLRSRGRGRVRIARQGGGGGSPELGPWRSSSRSRSSAAGINRPEPQKRDHPRASGLTRMHRPGAPQRHAGGARQIRKVSHLVRVEAAE